MPTVRELRFGIFLMIVLAVGPLSPGFAADVGKAIVVSGNVTGTIEERIHRVVIQDNVLQSEVIATEPDAATEIEFIDGSKLRVGPGAHVVLDKFVYDPDPSKGALVLRVSEGVFRFTTGRMAHEDYAIQTPAGLLGVRGTDFDFAVVGGKTIVHVYTGSVVAEPGFELSRLCTFSLNFNLLEGTRCSASDQAVITQMANEMNAILINPTGGGPAPTILPANQQPSAGPALPAETPPP